MSNNKEVDLSELKTLLIDYIETSVVRNPIGEMKISFNTPKGEQVIKAFLSRDNPTQKNADVRLSIEVARGKNNPYAYLKIRPEGDGNTVFVSGRKREIIEPEALIAQAKKGLEIFDTWMHLNPVNKLQVPKDRVHDYMQGEDKSAYMYMAQVLKRNIARIQRE